MSYTVETLNGCTRKLVFNFEALDLTQEIKNALLAKQKKANIKGFRVGKAPLSVVEKLFGPEVEDEAVRQFVSKQYFSALEQEKIVPVGYPAISKTNFVSGGKRLSFEAMVEVFPQFEVQNLNKLSFKKETANIDDQEMEDNKKRYLESKSEMKELADESSQLELGHFAIINFQGRKSNGETMDSLKAEEFMVEVGAQKLLKEFEDGLIGMKKGEKKEIAVTFPDDYHESSLKNEVVTFMLELLEIKQKVYPEFNDELAKDFGFESMEDFNVKAKENLLNQKERAVQQKLHQDILEKLVADTHFDVPKTFLIRQEESVRKELEENLKRQGLSDSMVGEYFEKWAEDITAKAEFQVRSGLILDHLAKKFNVEVGDKDFDAKLEEMVKGAGGISKEDIKKYYSSNEKLRSGLTYGIREEKTFGEILKIIQLMD